MLFVDKLKSQPLPSNDSSESICFVRHRISFTLKARINISKGRILSLHIFLVVNLVKDMHTILSMRLFYPVHSFRCFAQRIDGTIDFSTETFNQPRTLEINFGIHQTAKEQEKKNAGEKSKQKSTMDALNR